MRSILLSGIRYLLKNNLVILFFILLGLLARLYLVVWMPIWTDEAFSIQIAELVSIQNLFKYINDFAHPPGYYVLVKAMLMIDNHLWWLRMLSISAYLANIFLLSKLGKYYNKSLGKWLIIIYATSGYFLVFDWQVRAYSLILTTILLSVWIRTKESTWKSDLAWVVVNTIGICLDYSFFWYYFGQLLLRGYLLINENGAKWGNKWKNGLILVMPMLIFLGIYPKFLYIFEGAFGGVAWAGGMVDVKFFGRYFLGGMSSVAMLPLMLVALFLGIYVAKKSRYFGFKTIFVGALMGFVVTMLVSLFYSPLFHVRNLLVVGLSVMLLASFGIREYVKINNKVEFVVIPILIWGLWSNTSLLVRDPEKYGISPFDWKQVLQNNPLVESQSYGVDSRHRTRNDITNLNVWSLYNSLEGKDNIKREKAKYHRYEIIPDSCDEIIAPLYLCNN